MINKQAQIKIVQSTKEFLDKVGLTESEILIQVKHQKDRSREFVRAKRDEFKLDERLLNNQKENPELLGDTTLFNVHSALIARSFSDTININFIGGTGDEQKSKTLQVMFNEDNDTPEMKIMKYQQLYDKFLYGLYIKARVGWDGVYKRNRWQLISPKNWYPDINGNYVTGEYSYSGFDKLAFKSDMEAMGYLHTDGLAFTRGNEGIRQQQEDIQQELGLNPIGKESTLYDGQYEIYMHFAKFNGTWGWVITGNNEQLILSAGLCKAGNKYEEKFPELIKPGFIFGYWKPRRDDPFGFKVGDFTRDVQINKSKIANLRLDKMKAELYPMYLYNADYVKGSDLGFGFNKYIPFKSGIDGPVNPQNILSPIIPNTRMDASTVLDQLMDKSVERSTSIGEVAQGSTPEARETATTNSLVQSNTDINLSLNTKLDNIADEYFAIEWMKGYYINFTDADEKILFSTQGVMSIPLVIKKEDFFIDGNLKIKLESSSELEIKKNKQRLAYNQTVPLLLQDPKIPDISKRRALRRVWDSNNIPQDAIEIELPKTPDEIIQEQENSIILLGKFIGVNPDDDDLTHLIVVESVAHLPEGAIHKQMHLDAYRKKGKPQANPIPGDATAMNGLANQSMAQVGAESNSNASQQAQPQTA